MDCKSLKKLCQTLMMNHKIIKQLKKKTKILDQLHRARLRNGRHCKMQETRVGCKQKLSKTELNTDKPLLSRQECHLLIPLKFPDLNQESHTNQEMAVNIKGQTKLKPLPNELENIPKWRFKTQAKALCVLESTPTLPCKIVHLSRTMVHILNLNQQ